MSCPETRERLHAFLDGELDPAGRDAFQAHLRGCPDCTHELDSQRAIRSGLSDGGFRYTAPAGLRERVRASLGAAPPRQRRFVLSWLSAAALLLSLAGLAGAAYLRLSRPEAAPDLPHELVSAHVRSLQAEHLYDVESTDRHTVKPWFQGKVDFTPPVKDFKDQEYPLEGGRLDYVDERPVAALVYRRHRHIINLFVWPAEGPDAPPQATTRRGYNLLHWSQGGLTFWTVSDVNATELADFAELMRADKP